MEGRGNIPGKLFLKLLGIPYLSILLVEQLENYFLFAVEKNGLVVSMVDLASRWQLQQELWKLIDMTAQK